MKRAQIFSYDMMFAIIIFIAIIFTYFHFWDQTFTSISNWQKHSEMKKIGYDASQILIMSPGIPFNWNETSVAVVGLTTGEPNKIDNDKFARLESMNFTFFKEKMNLKGYNITIKVYNGAKHLETTIGDAIPADVLNKVIIDNFVSKSNSLHNLKVIIWE